MRIKANLRADSVLMRVIFCEAGACMSGVRVVAGVAQQLHATTPMLLKLLHVCRILCSSSMSAAGNASMESCISKDSYANR